MGRPKIRKVRPHSEKAKLGLPNDRFGRGGFVEYMNTRFGHERNLSQTGL